MNAMLASGGFHWTVIRVEQRDEYMAALEAASSGQDIKPFADFIAKAMETKTGNIGLMGLAAQST